MICTESEINAVEKDIGCRFPDEYRKFLLDPPPCLEFDVNVCNDPRDHQTRREIADRILEEGGSPKLPDTMFPFYAYQDVFFSAFMMNSNDDPVTVLYSPMVPVKRFEHFSSWVDLMSSSDVDKGIERVDEPASPEIRRLAKECLGLWECSVAAGSGLSITPSNRDPIGEMLSYLIQGVTIQSGYFKGDEYKHEKLVEVDLDQVRRHIQWIASEEFNEGYFQYRP